VPGDPEVPTFDEELLPPHPVSEINTKARSGATTMGLRTRFAASSKIEPSNQNILMIDIGGK